MSIEQLLCFGFLSDLGNIILDCVIAIAIVLCLVIMLKYPETRKFLGIAIGCVIIVIGIFSSIGLYKELSRKSFVNGSLDDVNMFSQTEFDYTSTSVAFYDNVNDSTDIRYFESSVVKVDDFNGLTKQYKVTLNDHTLLADIEAGYITTSMTMQFYDAHNVLLCEGTLYITIEFLSDKTNLKMHVENGVQAQYFEKYFKENGIRLKAIEVGGSNNG